MNNSRVEPFIDSLRRRQTLDRRAQEPQSSGFAAAEADAAAPPLFDPQVLGKLGRLELIARTVVDGILSGKHRSTHKGGCTDFAEYRPYALGDDIRQLDWRKYAKSDRYYVKRYEDETNLQALLVVDASGSMQFGMSTVSKWHYAQMASASLGHLLLRQRDSVGVAVVSDRLLDFVRPLPRANHLARVLDVLAKVEPAGESALEDELSRLAGRLKRRGLVVLLSDCFGEVARLKQVLQQFRARGHDVLIFQILAPEELSFPFTREAFFRDLELPRRLQINPNAVRKKYLRELQTFLDDLRQAVVAMGGDLTTISTDQNLGDALAYYLRRRAAMKTTHTVGTRG